MKRIALFLVIALSFARAASAANGTVGASTSDAVTISVSGGDFQNVHWEVRTAGTSKLTTEYTTDGVNWLVPPYSQRVDAITANPAVASWQNTTAVAGSYDTPIPGNTVAFRVRCGTTGTSTVLTLVAGKDYEPGNPVVAVLYDVTEGGVGAGITTGTLDMGGWSNLFVAASSPTGVAALIRPVDDTGTNISGVAVNFTAATAGSAAVTRGGSLANSATTVTANQIGAFPMLSRRLTVSIAAGGTVTQGRIRVEASR